MQHRLTPDEIEAFMRRFLGGETLGGALWAVAGDKLLTPGDDAIEDPATITVSVALRPRHAQFLRSIGVTHADLAQFLLEGISQARLVGANLVREQATKEPGDGKGVVMVLGSAVKR